MNSNEHHDGICYEFKLKEINCFEILYRNVIFPLKARTVKLKCTMRYFLILK